jgi:transcription initiation factor TFIIIB Brf1 subunit/transcription initiation factor TFIIB
MTASAPAIVLALPADLDTLLRRDLVALCEERGVSVAPRDTAAALRERLEENDLTARREREWQERLAIREASDARLAPVYKQVEGSFTCTKMPRRTISEALHAVEAAAGGGFASANDSDGREAGLLLAVDRLVAVLRAAADPASVVTLEDALLEAEAAENTTKHNRLLAERAREGVEARLRGILRTLEQGR